MLLTIENIKIHISVNVRSTIWKYLINYCAACFQIF